MPIISLENAVASFGSVPLLDKIKLQIDAGEKIFLVGRNGMGKSFLLKVLMGHQKLDDGKMYVEPNAIISELPQDLPTCNDSTVYEYVATGLKGLGNLLNRYHELTSPKVTLHDNSWMKEVEEVQKEIEQMQGWEYETTVNTILTRLDLSADKKIGSLSGGWKRRASLARAIVCKPDLLLLDEPTNHLDLEAIEWLEDFLSEYTGALLCITHDRSLLRKLSKRILELDRGHITSWNGDYDSFLANKEHRLEVEARQAREFDKVLAKEEAWIRQGIKARRTRNEGRVRALEKLRVERSNRRVLQDKPKFAGNQDSDSGNLVIQAKNINFEYGENTMVDNFSIRVHRGDKIALIGPNGAGKSTLLKLLLGDLKPQSGTIKLGTNLQVAYFDQMRDSIDINDTVLNNVVSGRESITVNGKEKHAISYLSDFLFTPEQARATVRMLSGGERNRLLLAKLFSLPSNLLVLDEPTNDLDIESLDLLEEVLLNYKGTILLVSHDRAFIDQVVTSTLVFRGNGAIDEYVGNFSDIPKINKGNKPTDSVKSKTIKKDKNIVKTSKESKASNDNSQAKKELRKIVIQIEKLESKKDKLHIEMAAPEFYQQDTAKQSIVTDKLSEVESELSQLYKRWEELE